MWWLSLFPYFAVPCVALAGVFSWALTRGHQPADGERVQLFFVALVVLLLAAFALAHTEFVRSRYDQAYQARMAFMKMPVHVALRDHRPDEWKPMELAAVQSFDDMVPPAEVLTQARRQYPRLARKWMETAQASAVVGYAEALVPVLDQLRASDPGQCVRMAWPQVPADPFDPSPRLSEPVNLAYEQAVARLVAQNSKSVVEGAYKAEASAFLPEVEAGLEEVRKGTAEKHGDAASQVHTIAVMEMDPVLACAATSDLIARTLMLEPRVARAMLTQLLKG